MSIEELKNDRLVFKNKLVYKDRNSCNLLIKLAMEERGLDFKDLVAPVNSIGYSFNYITLKQKINRGNFKADFFFDILSLLDFKTIKIGKE
jgi:hypothetical protein